MRYFSARARQLRAFRHDVRDAATFSIRRINWNAKYAEIDFTP